MPPPTDPRVRRFLGRSLIARIATVSPAGNPDIIPIWFVRFRGRVYMGTRLENPIVRDLLLQPAVVVMFHGERLRDSRHALRVSGRARFRQDWWLKYTLLPLFAGRYFACPGGLRNAWRNRRKLASARATTVSAATAEASSR